MKSSIIIIAEAGVNHNGSIEIACKLIDEAAKSGADIVKFQTFKAEKLVSKEARKAQYQKLSLTEDDDLQISMLKRLELDEKAHFKLIEHCKSKGIEFLSTGFDEESIDMLIRLGIKKIKIPSGEITNKPLLRHIAAKGLPVILSTGMSDMNDIRSAVEVLLSGSVKKSDLTILHCTTEYPAPLEDVNLKAMHAIAEEFDVPVGYSDHTEGIEVPVAAVAMGAVIIEKHFTIDRNLPGPDHKASLEPNELKRMIEAIRNIEVAISGDGIKKVSDSERKNLIIARKSIHIGGSLKAGDIIKPEHLQMKRPGDGISPMEIDNVIGKRIKIDLDHEEKLRWEWIGE
jgi:N-acetylneuraminate synthase